MKFIIDVPKDHIDKLRSYWRKHGIKTVTDEGLVLIGMIKGFNEAGVEDPLDQITIEKAP